MTGARRTAVMLVAPLLAGCAVLPVPVGQPAPTGPCLGDLPEIANLAFVRIARVELAQQGDTEVVRFVFDRSAPGFGSVTAEPASGPFFEASTDLPVAIDGDRLTSIKFEGLTGIGEADALRANPVDLAPVRAVIQVADRNVDRFVVGTVAGACLRFRVDDEAGTVALIVSPS
jgi:hypothetical protein